MPFNSIFAWRMKKRIHQIDLFRKYPAEVQEELMHKLIGFASSTEYGKKFNFSQLESYAEFSKAVPLQDYYGQLKLNGLQNLRELPPHEVNLFQYRKKLWKSAITKVVKTFLPCTMRIIQAENSIMVSI